jgi:nucleoside-diphosphate-sugar epimerase
VTGRPVPVVRKPGRALDVPVNVLDATRLSKAVGWTPESPLAHGLEKTWRWMEGQYEKRAESPA